MCGGRHVTAKCAPIHLIVQPRSLNASPAELDRWRRRSVKNCLTFLEDSANVAISLNECPPKSTGPREPLGTTRPPPPRPEDRRCMPDPLAVASATMSHARSCWHRGVSSLDGCDSRGSGRGRRCRRRDECSRSRRRSSTLIGRRATAQLIASARAADGSVQDQTRAVEWVSLNPEVAQITPKGRVVPKANGNGDDRRPPGQPSRAVPTSRSRGWTGRRRSAFAAT